jgi:broad specificity phosphatase PhoE
LDAGSSIDDRASETGDGRDRAPVGARPCQHRAVIEIVFETHSTSVDNEDGVASGWADCALSAAGRVQARALGARRRRDGLAVVLCSDLRRARETAELAFEGADLPILLDWRLRECDYGDRTQEPADRHAEDRHRFVDAPYPGGESWGQAVRRVRGVLADLPVRWDGRRVLLIGHVATRWALDHYLGGVPLHELAARGFRWQEGWEYRLDAPTAPD